MLPAAVVPEPAVSAQADAGHHVTPPRVHRPRPLPALVSPGLVATVAAAAVIVTVSCALIGTTTITTATVIAAVPKARAAAGVTGLDPQTEIHPKAAAGDTTLTLTTPPRRPENTLRITRRRRDPDHVSVITSLFFF